MIEAAAVVREIEELHRFFEGWFRGELGDDDRTYARFAAALAPEFRMVFPAGGTIGHADLLVLLRRLHGSRRAEPGFAIAVEDVEVRWTEGPRALARYREQQRWPDRWTDRHTLAAFRAEPSAPLGVAWTDLQETWIAA